MHAHTHAHCYSPGRGGAGWGANSWLRAPGFISARRGILKDSQTTHTHPLCQVLYETAILSPQDVQIVRNWNFTPQNSVRVYDHNFPFLKNLGVDAACVSAHMRSRAYARHNDEIGREESPVAQQGQSDRANSQLLSTPSETLHLHLLRPPSASDAGRARGEVTETGGRLERAIGRESETNGGKMEGQPGDEKQQ